MKKYIAYYKGFIAIIKEIDGDDELHGEVVNIRDVIIFKGNSLENVKYSFHNSVDCYIEWIKEKGEEPLSNENMDFWEYFGDE